ncbi:MAG: CBS domain-containing protein [Proteobacteria bacterium]|nr:CBS domain-containing protein [Pseudomonadota bacterium]
MKLSEVLSTKGNKVYRLKTDNSIAEAATKLTEKKIGALLVEDNDGLIVGILSERDIVGGMGPHGADLHDVPISELMTTNLIKCTSQDTVLQAMAMMTDRRVRHLPVFDGDDLIGVISLGDLVKCRISEVQSEAEALRQYIAS